MSLAMWKDHGPCWVEDGMIQSLAVQTCPKCGRYMQTIPVDFTSAKLIDCLGRWRCTNCGWIPSLNIFDEEGVKNRVSTR